MTLFHLWDLPGDVLAAPETASGLDRCNISLSLSLSLSLSADRGSTCSHQPLRLLLARRTQTSRNNTRSVNQGARNQLHADASHLGARTRCFRADDGVRVGVRDGGTRLHRRRHCPRLTAAGSAPELGEREKREERTEREKREKRPLSLWRGQKQKGGGGGAQEPRPGSWGDAIVGTPLPSHTPPPRPAARPALCALPGRPPAGRRAGGPQGGSRRAGT